jgi:hypothetical protein
VVVIAGRNRVVEEITPYLGGGDVVEDRVLVGDEPGRKCAIGRVRDGARDRSIVVSPRGRRRVMDIPYSALRKRLSAGP